MTLTKSHRVIRAAAFAMLLLLATGVLLEIGARAAFAFFEDWPEQASIRASLADVTADDEPAAPVDHENRSVLHPYLGYVRGPQQIPKHVKRHLPGVSINEFGFLGRSPLAARSDRVARVAITGGSVAEELFVYAGESLARDLEASGIFDERKVELVLLGMAGFKQPQQLLAVRYLTLLGADFDAVVNFDGFNEVVLPATEIVPLQVAPSYPFRWNALAINTIDSDTALAVAQIGETIAQEESWRSFFSSFPLPHSAFALASWRAVKTRLDGVRVGHEMELRKKLRASLESRPSMRGPPAEFDSIDALSTNSVAIWKRASIQLWQMCRSQGIRYLHVLQPNQYVEGSKPFTAAERKVAIQSSANTMRISAEAGYSRMIAAGAGLREMGLPFVDLTQIFQKVEKPIYRDHCCHYHKLGYAMVASRIARELETASF